MGELYVDPEAVERFGERLGTEGLAGDSDEAVSYHGSWCEIPAGSSGMYANFTGISADVYSSVNEALTHLRTTLRTSGAELEAVAEFYQRTDEETAAEMDRRYPG